MNSPYTLFIKRLLFLNLPFVPKADVETISIKADTIAVITFTIISFPFIVKDVKDIRIGFQSELYLF